MVRLVGRISPRGSLRPCYMTSPHASHSRRHASAGPYVLPLYEVRHPNLELRIWSLKSRIASSIERLACRRKVGFLYFRKNAAAKATPIYYIGSTFAGIPHLKHTGTLSLIAQVATGTPLHLNSNDCVNGDEGLEWLAARMSEASSVTCRDEGHSTSIGSTHRAA